MDRSDLVFTLVGMEDWTEKERIELMDALESAVTGACAGRVAVRATRLFPGDVFSTAHPLVTEEQADAIRYDVWLGARECLNNGVPVTVSNIVRSIGWCRELLDLAFGGSAKLHDAIADAITIWGKERNERRQKVRDEVLASAEYLRKFGTRKRPDVKAILEDAEVADDDALEAFGTYSSLRQAIIKAWAPKGTPAPGDGHCACEICAGMSTGDD